MKIRFVFIFVIALASCHVVGNKRLVGNWELIEFRLVGQGGDPVSDEEILRKAGAVWDLKFVADGKFSQEFNMRTPSMKMEIEEGSWKTANDSLIIDLQLDSGVSKLNYTYKFENYILILTLSNLQSKSSIITRFRKK
ncbi:MAG: hypothetical protein HOG79_07505 [Prolixibacteraceae bacterium]|nr:hypothetical protein [Prolixibacteraceae bacterium]